MKGWFSVRVVEVGVVQCRGIQCKGSSVTLGG